MLLQHPLAITMWDFSWLERRWTGAGYRDIAAALDQLAQRGYDAVRIDAYPHLAAADPQRSWELVPCWSVHAWGAPSPTRVQIQPHLNHFIELAGQRGIRVALSSWFREDATDQRKLIPTPQRHAEIWTAVLDQINDAGLLHNILFVDLCNEWPLPQWAPFFHGPPQGEAWALEPSIHWMQTAIASVQRRFPNLPCCFSFTGNFRQIPAADLPFMDLLEPHIWMATCSDFYQRIGYSFQRFDETGYQRLANLARPLFSAHPQHWLSLLDDAITTAARWSTAQQKPLVTTECWGLVDYKDAPLLEWDFIQTLCDHGTRSAARTGRWAAIATSNFCGPQFAGMWDNIPWHRALTDTIHNAALPPDMPLWWTA